MAKKDLIDFKHLTDDEIAEKLICKAYSFKYDIASGQVKLVRNGQRLNLEETAYMMWLYDGKPGKKPMTKTGMMKQEQKICQKIKAELNKRGFKDSELHDLLEVMSRSGRQPAACCDRVEDIGYTYAT